MSGCSETPRFSNYDTLLTDEERFMFERAQALVPLIAERAPAATLRARGVRWGTNSPLLAEWLRGQDAVFKNCSGGEETPPPAPRMAWRIPRSITASAPISRAGSSRANGRPAIACPSSTS